MRQYGQNGTFPRLIREGDCLRKRTDWFRKGITRTSCWFEKDPRHDSLRTSLVAQLSVPSVSALARPVDELSAVQARLDDVAVLSGVVVSADAVVSVVPVSVLLGRLRLSPTGESLTETTVPWRRADALDFLLADGDSSVVMAHVRCAAGTINSQ